MRVTLAWSPEPRQVREMVLELREGSTVRDAVIAGGLPVPGATGKSIEVQPGIWGRAVNWDQRVRDLDRIELCRPLVVDPKVARRERFAQQGARATGLFARQRSGGKPGY